MGGLGSCTCLRAQSSQVAQYYFQVYGKLPVFGALKDYQKIIRGEKPFTGYPNATNSQNILSIDQNGAYILPAPAGGSFLPAPRVEIRLSNLLNLKPIQNIKGDTSVFNITKANDLTFIKKIKKSNYVNLVRSMEGTDQKFTDLQFPPTLSSLGQRFSMSQIKWLRIHQFIKNPVFINENINPNDVIQGNLGDCYFFSAISSLAQQQYRVKNLFPSLQINKNGIYMVRVLFNGVYQQVVVDDFFPINGFKEPLFAKPAGGKEIWVMILQKVWAKLYGSYEAIDGGVPYQVSHAFTTAPVYLKKIPAYDKKKQNLWKHLLQVQQKGYLLSCGTKDDQTVTKEGILQGHAYTILGVYDKPSRLLKIRNPWGRRQFRGKASDYDNDFWKQVSEEDKKKLDYEDSKRKAQKDGIFFITWQDFCIFFKMIDVCKINDNAHYNFLKTDFENKVPKLFQFQLRQKARNLTFAVTQPSIRGTDLNKYSRTYMALGKWDQNSKSYKYINSCSDKRMADNYLEVKIAQPGKYVLYVRYLWNKKSAEKAIVSIYSEYPVNMEEIQSQIDLQQFLKQIFYDHASKNKRKILINQEGDWVCNEILLNQGGFSYFVVQVNKNSKKKLGVTLNQSQYLQKKLYFQHSLKGCQIIKKQVTNSQPFILVAQLLKYVFPSELINPSPQVVVLQ